MAWKTSSTASKFRTPASPAALSGVLAGATIDNNLLIATDGVRALEPPQEEAPDLLVSAVLRIDNNVFWCKGSAVRLAGKVGHAYETRMTGNQVLVLLCHKVNLRLTHLQCGQCPRFLASATLRRRRSVVIESAT